MIVRWSDPDLQLHSLSWCEVISGLQLRQKYSECNVFGVVFFFMYVYAASAHGGRLLSVAGSSDIYSQIKPLIKVAKLYLMSVFCS